MRSAVRLFFLLAAVLCLFGGPLPEWILRLIGKEDMIVPPSLLPAWCVKIVPSVSPLFPFQSTLVKQRWFLDYVWLIPPLALIALAIFKGRFFCRWCCPLGTLFSIPSNFGGRYGRLDFRPNGILFWASLFSAGAGFSLFLFLDPLSTFSRLGTPLNGVVTVSTLFMTLVFFIFFILSFIQPMVWCSHWCPLGYFLGLAHKPKLGYPRKFDRARRDILIGLGIGVPAGYYLRKFGVNNGENNPFPVLPPGAVEPEQYSSACVRCYACVNVCPSHILQPELPTNGKIGSWFQPQMNADKGACDEFCNACTQVCPTGAILPLTVEQKRVRQIGVAKVERDACLAWADGEFCMVCDEYCPYNAIINDESDSGIPRPIVNKDLCRGCGFCQNHCPAVKKGVAIRVDGVESQKVIGKHE